MMKLLTGGNPGRWLAVTATALAAATWCAPAPAEQQGVSHASPHNRHRAPSAASAASPAEQDILDADDARFFLTRVGFAPDSGEVAQYVGLTREQAVDKVLATARTESVTPLPEWVLEPIPTREIRKTWTDDQRRDEQRLRGQRYELLRAWWVREMLSTPSPLTERMTLFWHNHFTSGQDKVQYPQQMAQQNMLLRRDALGNFGELLHDVAKDPAMLQYLDGASNRKGKPNENFAREVMELFTLGEGHYTQRDVSEAARAYTGWSLDPDTQAYVWRANQHDDGDKTVLGQTGPFDGDQVLDILLARPETATFVTTKLWREFVSDTPDPARIAPIAAQFRASHYDIKVALRGLLMSDAFWNDDDRGVLVKSPAEFVVGTLRAFDIGYDNTGPFAAQIRTLGENLFYPPNVKGWPGGTIWINSSTLLARKQFVEQLFRATETAGPRRMNNPMSAKTAASGAPGNMQAIAPLQRTAARVGQGGVRFDIDTWLAHYNTAPTAKPGLSAELQLQHAVLPLTPVDAIETDSTASAYLEALLMDPAYQLK
ncbi:hypothetical protein R69927_03622 [Paraburkholderia domus]|uniref:DUF1800 domain-containing protein n=1 Tax=Paraburkholderia domus TaxID=2793075 RepID=A0A9N8N4U0_9BURK|nr:DUF1800 domain-containing protein [Paraburkholderia domus]MBK5053575.1 DUF1800 domain-containing protein [Burkholderia sp. R-70006]MBK5062373.1 DUF1800 domain-containing protein [Burkholderia sp. R-70199]MBK5087887.1 DUF1800 domain-containing protein [Burkholderia sp. R-69927]MBK5120743.1 DUF1800 domain-containing protein [Burkholderia sp. R-69980]MBK5166989.1 DUF1800 domain-containing protein [Burkholderia sp. R-70211]MBK5181433.1 DUF1800 domain-containing protein [Burkholderia sp. R-6974